ncbi:MAG: dihydroorotate dehydrogenase [Thermoplasmata archaeon]
MTDMRTKVASLHLDNPLMLASGILDENGFTMKRILENGAAAVVTKSIGAEERPGYPTPVIVEYGESLINAIGLSNPGIDNFSEEMKIVTKNGRTVIGSVFSSDADGFAMLSRKMESYGASAIELNLSCPHVKGFGMEVGSDPDLVKAIVERVKSSVNIPVFAKLSPNTSNILEIAEAAEKADGYVLINTVKAMAIDIYSKTPVLSNNYGGLSGPAIKPVGIRYVYEVKKATGKPIIGVGGISTAEDAIEYIMAGSSAIQIGTAIFKKGISIFNEIKSGIQKFMEAEGYRNIEEMTGVAVK